jgi:phenylacetate-CoA ligase
VNLFPTQIEELVLATPGLSPHFQCVLKRAGNLDHLTVRVERHETVDYTDGVTAASLLRQVLKNRIGVSIGVEVVEPGAVERSAGKMRRVIDERDRR